MMAIRESNVGLMETNIDPSLQDDELMAGPVEELVKVPMDLFEPSSVLKIGKI